VANLLSSIPQGTTKFSTFGTSHSIPSDLLHEYFQQEHFSLKRLVNRYSLLRCRSANLTVVHTRSDQFIHSIPCLPADRIVSIDDGKTVDTVLKLVHDNPDVLIIEHVERLRSESAVRGAIQSWAQHASRNIFLMLANMSQAGSFDRGTIGNALCH
jgi:hypothetical protein